MSELQNLLFARASFIPAELQHHKNSNGWLVVFYVRNPVTDSMDKYRVKLNRLKSKYTSQLEFKAAAKRICDDFNAKLQGGWTPYGVSMNARMFEKLVPVLQSYIEEKKKELTFDTLRSYISMVAILTEWVNKTCPNCTCENFNTQMAVRFMEDRWRGGISPRTYNNNIKGYRTMFVWLIEHCFCKENPFEHIKPKITIQKKRTFIPEEKLMDIFRYCKEENRPFYIVMLLVYYSGLRPTEITRIKRNQVDLEHGCILLDTNQTKNHKEGISNLSNELVELLREHLKDALPNDYVFGIGDFMPNKEAITVTVFQKRWSKLRDTLNLPSEYQLYSLRDSSGVHRFNNGASALDIMKSLRHSNLTQTTIYTNHYDAGLHKRLEEVTPHI